MSRSGKTAQVVLETDSALPLLVWDPEGQWSAMQRTKSLSKAQLTDALVKGIFGRFSYTGPLKDFDWFCELAFAWARLMICTIVVEETSDVTNPGKAPQWWGTLIRRSLKYGATIYGITQSPAESDKTIVRNSGRKLCFEQEREEDQVYMARVMACEFDRVAALEKLHYLEKIRGKPLRACVIPRAELRKLASPPAF